MHPSRSCVLSLVAFVVLAAAWGCGDGAPPVETSTEEAKVGGTVTVNGKLATKGYVIFDPSNVQRKTESQRKAVISPEGTYRVVTMIGENTVRVETPEVMKDRVLSDISLSYDVPKGESTYEIVLPPK